MTDDVPLIRQNVTAGMGIKIIVGIGNLGMNTL